MSFLNDKTILVTGAGGTIGSELCHRLLRQEPAKLVAFDISEIALYNLDMPGAQLVLGDVSNETDVFHLLYATKFDIIYHAAAYKHVSFCQQNPVPAWRVNAYGTKTLVRAAKEHGVPKLILISTDKAVWPTCVMGETKKWAEICVRQAGYTVVRLGNVLESSGSVVPLWRKQIKERRPVTITDVRAERYFIPIERAASQIIEASEIAQGGDTFVPDMGEPRNIVKFAQSFGATKFNFVGLRPGEKLKEELFVGERSCTSRPGIWQDAA